MLDHSVLKRLQNEKKEIEQAIESEDLDSSIIHLGPKNQGGTKKLELWTLRFKGREGTDLYPGVYDVEIKIKTNYPSDFPDCAFLNGFKHYHVYSSGAICLPLLKASGWSINKGIKELSEAIVNMVHSPPTVNDTANPVMQALYKKNPQDYRKMLREQAQDFKKYA